ncbi:MAG: HisA/HisF-related TIM barrel protein, partial [Hydrogenimonas sp.]|nr:HisA/HisF-related TIM barrel protein [Hydrogenimonas sp.]
GVDTIASGGVRDMSDIEALLETKKVAGVIVGKAFYEGTLDLEEAFKLTQRR